MPLDVPRLRGAIVQQIRFQMYWWGRQDLYRSGETLPLHIASDGSRFVAMIEDFELLPDGRHVVAIFNGRQGQDRTWILQSSSTPLERGDPLKADWWMKLDPDLKDPSMVRETLTVPTNGEPHIEPDSPPKKRMRKAVVSSMQRTLSWNVAHRREKLLPLVTLVVADFNVEDPNAFVLVEETKSVYEVYLFDPGDPADPRHKVDEVYRFDPGDPADPRHDEGPFLAWPVAGHPSDEVSLRAKIRKVGVAHRVALSPTSPDPPRDRTP